MTATTWIGVDLDGTLVETAPEIADAVNDTLTHLGHPPAEQSLIEGWIGHGTGELLIQALAWSRACSAEQVRQGADLAGIRRVFNQHYRSRCGTRSRLYPDVRDTLNDLRARGCRLALVTNKEWQYTDIVLRAHALPALFHQVVAGDSLPSKKPDPAGVLACLEAWGLRPDQALFVGDSSIDAATARNAGMAVWLLPYGYNMGQPIDQCRPDRVITSIKALLGPH
jgi:phosphoglycolate phosphatase